MAERLQRGVTEKQRVRNNGTTQQIGAMGRRVTVMGNVCGGVGS